MNFTQEVDQATLWSGQQLQPLELVRKEEEKMTPKGPPASENAKGKIKEATIPSSSNSKGTSKRNESTKDHKKDITIPVHFQVRQRFHKERVPCVVISHLK